MRWARVEDAEHRAVLIGSVRSLLIVTTPATAAGMAVDRIGACRLRAVSSGVIAGETLGETGVAIVISTGIGLGAGGGSHS